MPLAVALCFFAGVAFVEFEAALRFAAKTIKMPLLSPNQQSDNWKAQDKKRD